MFGRCFCDSAIYFTEQKRDGKDSFVSIIQQQQKKECELKNGREKRKGNAEEEEVLHEKCSWVKN